ncbi:MAG TPA: DNA/RNA helicase domain-containing protein, partial [Candidatus Polarisedimenticolaceae bacterium]
MRLYSGLSPHFIKDNVHNRIAEKLTDAFRREFRHAPPPSEVASWRNSLRAISQVLDDADFHDHGILLEYQLPMTSKRLDCMVTGQDGEGRDAAVIIELKQWERCGEAGAENLVTTRLGGAERDVLHPSAQVGQYRRYLEDSHTAFYEPPAPIRLGSCAYLHNYRSDGDDVLFADRFRPILESSPVFTMDDVEPLQAFLAERVREGRGEPVLRRVEQSRYRPSRKLLEHVGQVVKGNPAYVLLDEQLVVYERVLATARRGFDDRRKTVLIVRGGPGTGKSVIAMNLLGDLSLGGFNAQYATGSRAFTETLKKIIGTRGSSQFKYFNNYAEADVNAIDVLICDEAHRIRETSSNRYTPKEKRSTKPQVDELLDASKVCVFFVDDRQAVRPGEIGTADYLRGRAEAQGCAVLDYRLEAQFRCAGSDAFVNWVNNTLGIEPTANILWQDD